MNEEQLLKLNAYLKAVCAECDRCTNCPFNDEKNGTCFITFIIKRLRTLSNINNFDVISDEKYNELAEEVSLEEIKLELGDFANEYCENTICDNCCFHDIAAGRCSLGIVENIIKEKIKSP